MRDLASGNFIAHRVPYPVRLAKAVERQKRADAKRVEANRIIRERNLASRVQDPGEIVVDDVVRRELWLSRIAAAALQPEFPDSNLTTDAARRWLAEIEDIRTVRLGSVIVEELRRLRLIRIPE